AAYSDKRIDIAGAVGRRDRLTFERAPGEPEELVRGLGMPLGIRVGTSSKTRRTVSVELGAEGLPWVVRVLGAHDYLELVAPTSAGLRFQLIPFDAKVSCEKAMDYAVAGQPKAL